jgi:hypothetical protein
MRPLEPIALAVVMFVLWIAAQVVGVGDALRKLR